MTLYRRSILLIISGGIAAYKSLELIRLLRAQGTRVSCLLTAQAENFVTPLTVATLSEEKVYQDRTDLIEESQIGHIQLSRQAGSDRDSPGHREYSGQDGRRDRRRSRNHDPFRLE